MAFGQNEGWISWHVHRELVAMAVVLLACVHITLGAQKWGRPGRGLTTERSANETQQNIFNILIPFL